MSMKTLSVRTGFFPVLLLFACSNPKGTSKLPARLCDARASKNQDLGSDSPKLGIVNGAISKNESDLEKTVAAVIIVEHHSDNRTNEKTCSAVVAGKDTLISAAHCFQKEKNAAALERYITFENTAENVQEGKKIAIKEVLMHSQFKNNEPNFDIALIRTKNPIPASQRVASFLASDLKTKLSEGTPVTIVGYGDTQDPNEPFGIKRKATTAVDSFINVNGDTTYVLSALRNQVRIKDNARSVAKAGACNGDSGGPGFIGTSSVVFGIVQGTNSAIQGKDAYTDCTSGDVNYTLIAPFINWIQSSIGFNLNTSGKAITVDEAYAWGGLGGSYTGDQSVSSSDSISSTPSCY